MVETFSIGFVPYFVSLTLHLGVDQRNLKTIVRIPILKFNMY